MIIIEVLISEVESSLLNDAWVWELLLTFSSSKFLHSKKLHSFWNQFKCYFYQKASNGTKYDRISVCFLKLKLSVPGSGYISTYIHFCYMSKLMSFSLQPSLALNHTVYPGLFYYILIEVIYNRVIKESNNTDLCMCEETMRISLEMMLG